MASLKNKLRLGRLFALVLLFSCAFARRRRACFSVIFLRHLSCPPVPPLNQPEITAGRGSASGELGTKCSQFPDPPGLLLFSSTRLFLLQCLSQDISSSCFPCGAQLPVLSSDSMTVQEATTKLLMISIACCFVISFSRQVDTRVVMK